jgi:hypothetical protein
MISHTLISTWLKVLPLYTPITLPIISGTMIMLRRCVLTGSGFSPEGASRFCKEGWQRDFFKIRTFQTQNSQTWSSDEVSHISKLINTDTWTYCFAEFLDQGHGLAFQTPLKPVTQIPTDKTIQSVRKDGNPTLLHLSSLHFLLYSRRNTDINNNSTI